jgi:hypothetical protein
LGWYLKQQKEQEVDVRDPLELLKEVEWQEGEEVVFRGLNAVGLRAREQPC